MNAGEWAEVGSAVFTATAAFCALVAVRQSQREWRAAREPALSVDVVAVFPSRTMQLHISNVGGPVIRAMVVVIEGQQACMGFLPPTSFLHPGEIRTYGLKLGASEMDKATAVVYGFDAARRYVYAWAANGRSHKWRVAPSRRQRTDNPSAVDILRRFYPGAPNPFDLELRPHMDLMKQTFG